MRDPLAQLRLRLTAWYAGTFAVILLVLGIGLFAAIARQIDRELDASVRRAALELIGGLALSTPITLYVVPTLLVAIRGRDYQLEGTEG